MKKIINYFTKTELLLWSISALTIIVSFILFDRESYLTLAASLTGITSLIFCSKGNPVGQVLMIVFSIIYTYISYTFSYYGEMLTYCGMTLPMAALSLVTWLKNPYKGKKSEVSVNKLKKKDIIKTVCYSIAVTAAFFFILKSLETENLYVSTLSVTTSFAAAYLTYKRSPYFALLYAMNDLVLIALWIYASIKDISYISVMICFCVFFINDMYAFISWRKMEKRQIN